MVKNPSIYVLDDQHVAVFDIELDGYNAKVECLFDGETILDYTIEYNGPFEKRENLLKTVFKEAEKLIKLHISYK